jgi:hypothetical protein
MWALLPVKPTASGFADHIFLILARFTHSSLPALISRLLNSHPHIYLGPMGLSPSCRLLGLVGKNVCVFCFLCRNLYPNSSTPCRPLFRPLIPGKPMASGLTYQVFVILARFSTPCHGWPLFWDSEPYLHWA